MKAQSDLKNTQKVKGSNISMQTRRVKALQITPRAPTDLYGT